ncbi:MAG: class I SAM-dependent methyltransferase [Saprospiraceae bacterium]
MQALIFRFRQFLKFYWNAVTKYQLHSPFVFDLVNAVLEDERWYYAFRDVERVRGKMLESAVKLEVTDFGTGKTKRHASVRQVARQSSSSPRQGRMLFRLANWASPTTVLELGTSLGVGAMYLASGMRSAKFITLEGCADFAQVARTNLEILELKNAEVVTGEFDQTLPQVLQNLQKLDFVFFDGNHRPEPTLRYFETCLPFSHENTVFVFDDAYWSPDMTQAWEQIKQHPRVTLTVDFFDLSLAFIASEFREKQHFKVVPKTWKPWKIF